MWHAHWRCGGSEKPYDLIFTDVSNHPDALSRDLFGQIGAHVDAKFIQNCVVEFWRASQRNMNDSG